MVYTYIGTESITSSTSEVDITIASGYDEIVFQFHQYRGGDSHGRGMGFQVNTASATSYNRPMQTGNYGISSGYGYDWQGASFYGDDGTNRGWQHSSVAGLQGIVMAGENETGGDISQMSSSGMLTLYKPKASGTSWKHFIANGNGNYKSGGTWYAYCHIFSGYIKETDALTTIRFAPFSGNFERVIINQYGLS